MKVLQAILITTLVLVTKPSATMAQSDEIQQLILNYQKLAQLKSILQNMKKGYDIINKGYNTVKDLSNGNFKLHDAFLNGLLQVNPSVKNYKRVADIIHYQSMIVQEYKAAYNGFSKDKHFRPDDLSYLSTVYSNLFNKSLDNLDELTLVVTASRLRMSDAERLQAIDRIFQDTESKLLFLRSFNNRVSGVAAYRAKLTIDNSRTKRVYGLNK